MLTENFQHEVSYGIKLSFSLIFQFTSKVIGHIWVIYCFIKVYFKVIFVDIAVV